MDVPSIDRSNSRLPGARPATNLPVTRTDEGWDEDPATAFDRPGFGAIRSWVSTGMTADAAPDGYTHHVIGAVHEVTVEPGGPEALTRAVQHELNCCQAPRIVVDLTKLEELTEGHLEALRPLTLDSDRVAVRLREQAARRMGTALEEMGVRDVITEHSPHRAGPTGLSGQQQG